MAWTLHKKQLISLFFFFHLFFCVFQKNGFKTLTGRKKNFKNWTDYMAKSKFINQFKVLQIVN